MRILAKLFLLVVMSGAAAGDIVDPLASSFLPSAVAEMKKVNPKYFDNRFTVYNVAPTWGGMIQIYVVFQR